MQGRSRCLHTFRSSWKGRAHHVGVPWNLGPVPLQLHCSRGRAWSGRCRVSCFRPLSNPSSLGLQATARSACQLFVRIRAWDLHAVARAYYGGRAVAEEDGPSRSRESRRSRSRPSRASSARPICESCGAGRRSPYRAAEVARARRGGRRARPRHTPTTPACESIGTLRGLGLASLASRSREIPGNPRSRRPDSNRGPLHYE